ncbi:TfoX/Sxy family protein [Candidatus Saccharibacteria bacterium]|nr:TfoX/Sxy family protein [Candidatus Saccharibacteria bacterium]
MASSEGFVEYVMEQLEDVGILRYRKMFGEFCVYVNEKPIVLVCDDRIYLKKVAELEEVMVGQEVGVPYDGASERWVVDVDDRELLREAVEILDAVTPVPMPKKRKEK